MFTHLLGHCQATLQAFIQYKLFARHHAICWGFSAGEDRYGLCPHLACALTTQSFLPFSDSFYAFAAIILSSWYDFFFLLIFLPREFFLIDLPLERHHFLTVTVSWWRARHMSYEFWPLSCERWLRKYSLGELTEEAPLAVLSPEQIQLISIFSSSPEVQKGASQPTLFLIAPVAMCWHLFSASWECVEPVRWEQGEEGERGSFKQPLWSWPERGTIWMSWNRKVLEKQY